MFSRKPIKGSKRLTRFSSECAQYSTFSGKINDLDAFRGRGGDISRFRVKLVVEGYQRFQAQRFQFAPKKRDGK
jgi:hypothetical protein